MRSISWVAIDLIFTTSLVPLERARSITILLASSAFRAQWTVIPAAVMAFSAWMRY